MIAYSAAPTLPPIIILWPFMWPGFGTLSTLIRLYISAGPLYLTAQVLCHIKAKYHTEWLRLCSLSLSPISQSNKSLYCSVMISLICVSLITSFHYLVSGLPTSSSSSSSSLSLSLSLSLSCQMVSLYRDPQGKKIFDGMDSASYHVTSTIPSTIIEDGRSEH